MWLAAYKQSVQTESPDTEKKSTVLTDSRTGENCCLFHDCILEMNTLTDITVYTHRDFGKLNVSLASNPDGIKINVRPTHDSRERPHVKRLQGLWVLIGDYEKTNAGHVLGDEAFAVWQSLSALGLENEEINIITSNDGIHQQQYECLTHNKIHCVTDFYTTPVSVEKLVVGMGRSGFALGHSNGRGPRALTNRASFLTPFKQTFEAFRRHAYKIFNVPDDDSSRKSILLLDKDASTAAHNCKLHRIHDVRQLLARKFESYDVRIMNWKGMKIEDQVKACAKARIVVTLPGSDMMNCIFVKPDCHIVYPLRFNSVDKKGSKHGSNEVDIWFQHTHNCVPMSNVSAVKEGKQLFSKINDMSELCKIIADVA
jgi:hypothetical protein